MLTVIPDTNHSGFYLVKPPNDGGTAAVVINTSDGLVCLSHWCNSGNMRCEHCEAVDIYRQERRGRGEK